MPYQLATDAVLVLHALFIAYVVAGGLLALRWLWTAWVHLPAAAWGTFVELSGSPCPLTTLENHLRLAAGAAAYGDDFIAHYLLGIIYPAGLTSSIQLVLAGGVLLANAVIYAAVWYRRKASV